MDCYDTSNNTVQRKLDEQVIKDFERMAGPLIMILPAPPIIVGEARRLMLAEIIETKKKQQNKI